MRPKSNYEKRVAEINATLTQNIAQSVVDKVINDCKEWDMAYFCYFTVYSNIQEFEVKRLYRVYAFPTKSITHYFFVEIIREFNDNGKTLYFSKKRCCFNSCQDYDTFAFNSDIVLRSTKRNGSGYSICDLFRLSLASYPEDYSCSRKICSTINPNELAIIIKNNPVAENLYKTNDWLFGYLIYEASTKEVCRAITIAKRHGFVFTHDNASLWFDMVRAMVYCKKDYHNPVYVAPTDLLATHDMFIAMADRKRRKEYEIMHRGTEARRHELQRRLMDERIEKDKTCNERYIKRRKKFYDMVITDGLIECRVLRDVQAFKDEGLAMDHCVYAMGYFNKPYSLILSARINDKRIETIEVDLASYTIKQCYGKHDQFTMYHSQILNLVKSNMDMIIDYNKGQVRTKTRVAV